MGPPGDKAPDRVAIILDSGSYERVNYAFSLATVSLAMGCEVHILLTHGALPRFTHGRLHTLGEETPAQIRPRLERGLASGGIQSLEQSLAGAKKLGLKLYACANAMANMNISRDELIQEVDEVMGLATFIDLALGAAINWYI